MQLAVFGVYMGASFAVNHTGMPMLPHDSKVDFLRRQVLTSRNIRGGWSMSIFMGGLNHQVEHHLFPNMPRPNLFKAREIVREYCETHDILYTETNVRAGADARAQLPQPGRPLGSRPLQLPAGGAAGSLTCAASGRMPALTRAPSPSRSRRTSRRPRPSRRRPPTRRAPRAGS